MQPYPAAPPAGPAPAQAAPAAPAQAGPPPPVHHAGAEDAVKLHQLALDAYHALSQLATGLAHAGADPGSTKSVQAMADTCQKVVKALGAAAGQAQPAQPTQPAAPADAGGQPPASMADAHNQLVAMLAARRAQNGGQ